MSIVKGVAFFTGSAQDIGRGIALRLAKYGFDTALNDVPSKRGQLRSVADEIEKIGRRAHLVPADVTIEEDVKAMIQGAVETLGGLDVVSFVSDFHRRVCIQLPTIDGSEYRGYASSSIAVQ